MDLSEPASYSAQPGAVSILADGVSQCWAILLDLLYEIPTIDTQQKLTVLTRSNKMPITGVTNLTFLYKAVHDDPVLPPPYLQLNAFNILCRCGGTCG